MIFPRKVEDMGTVNQILNMEIEVLTFARQNGYYQ